MQKLNFNITAKSKAKKFIVFVIASIIVFSSLLYVGASSKVLFQSIRKQERTLWCWAACAQQSGFWWANYNEPFSSRPLEQSEIVRHVKGSVVNAAANGPETAQAAKFAAYSSSKANATAAESFYFNFNTIKGFINQGKPLICNQFNFNAVQPIGHIILVSGYVDTSTKKNVIYVDPDDGKRYEISYDKFVSGWNPGYTWVWAVYWHNWN
ncbi:UNVERIFIED_CONTAM: papain like cysteine protease AvrRpt2 [Acetivibrio alkalicellulosi]